MTAVTTHTRIGMRRGFGHSQARLARLRVTFLVAFLVMILSVSPSEWYGPSAASAQAGPGPGSSAPQVPRFEPAACPVRVPADLTIECGYLVVPEDRRDPDSPEIRLAVGIARSRVATRRPDPVVYLHGGPGDSVVGRVGWWARSPFLTDRDVIVFDQRGAGASLPRLDCPEMLTLAIETLTRATTFEQAALTHAEGALACASRLVNSGVDLPAYNNRESAADLEDLRLALGIEQWNLFAYSAGTRLALFAMQDYPAGIRSAILDSVYMPPGIDYYAELAPGAAAAFDALFAACAADADCQGAYPALRANFVETVNRLNEVPLSFAARDPFTGEWYQAAMNGRAFVGVIFRLMYDRSSLGSIPKLIADVHAGRSARLADLLAMPLREPLNYSMGLNQTIHCTEAAPFTSRERIDAVWQTVPAYYLGFYHWDVNPFALVAMCDEWPRRTPDPRDNMPVTSEIPTLILAGQLDPAAPLAHAHFAAQTLARSVLVEFAPLSHRPWDWDACPRRIAADFLAAPDQPPDTSCTDSMGHITFVTGDRVFPVSGMYDFTEYMRRSGYTLDQFGPLFLTLPVFFAAPLFALLSVLRRRPLAERWRIGHWLAGLLVAFILVSLGGVLLTIAGVDAQDWGLFMFGVPTESAMFFMLPVLVGLLAVALLVLTLAVWRSGAWPLLVRAYYLALALAGVLVFVWAVGWRMLPLL